MQVQHRAYAPKEDPARILPLDPRDQAVLRAKQLRRAADAARQGR